jgi:hypothetical protein
MTVIEGVLLEEKERNLAMQKRYLEEIETLPKGSVTKKKINGKEYYYLIYRKGNKVITEYLGNDEAKIDEVKKKINTRKSLENSIKKLKLELKIISKTIKR